MEGAEDGAIGGLATPANWTVPVTPFMDLWVGLGFCMARYSVAGGAGGSGGGEDVLGEWRWGDGGNGGRGGGDTEVGGGRCGRGGGMKREL